MRHLKEWGGEPELAAAASIFGFKVHIHHPFFPTGGVQVIQAPAEKRDREGVDVHLVYYGDHYDVAYHESRPFKPESRKKRTLEASSGQGGSGDSGGSDADVGDEGVPASDGDVGDSDTGAGVTNQKRWMQRGKSKTGHRISSTEDEVEDVRTKARLPGLGLSKTTK
jgi:hypothetical protein